MGSFLVYIIKSAVCLALLFAGYHWLLRRETFHHSNRMALLGMLALSFLLPGLSTLYMEGSAAETNLPMWGVMTHAELPTDVMVGAVPVAPSLDWPLCLVACYLPGVVVLFLKEAVGLFLLARVLRSGSRQQLSDGIWLVLHHRPAAPFSWMNHIVMSDEDYRRHGTFIMAHERGHIRHRHSWDLLGVGLCVALQWFNPVVWLLKRELHDIHEYEADDAVVSQGLDRKQYQLLLIEKAVGTRRYSMADSFNHSSLKKRITMMKKEKSNPWARAKYLYMLPLAAVAVTAFARPETAAPLSRISEAEITDLAAMAKAKEVEKEQMTVPDTVRPAGEERPVYDIVEQMPEFPGGTGELQKYLAKSVKYPTKALENGQTGRVVVRFVIEQDGTVTNPQVVRSIALSLDAEAVRVVKQMPRWKPGRQRGKNVAVRYVLPISFFLDSVPPSADTALDEVVVVGCSKTPAQKPEDTDKHPLFVLDGKEIPAEELQNISREAIASVSVLKDKSAAELYGDKGKDGVVLITTKGCEGHSSAKKVKDNVLILCDGNPISGDVLQALSPDKIESIEVMKDSVSRAKYQAADKEGVILVKLKR